MFNTSQVCLSMLDEWTGDMDLEDIVMGLLFLMQNPQIDDPLNGNFRGDEKYPDFVRKVCTSVCLHNLRLIELGYFLVLQSNLIVYGV